MNLSQLLDLRRDYPEEALKFDLAQIDQLGAQTIQAEEYRFSAVLSYLNRDHTAVALKLANEFRIYRVPLELASYALFRFYQWKDCPGSLWQRLLSEAISNLTRDPDLLLDYSPAGVIKAFELEALELKSVQPSGQKLMNALMSYHLFERSQILTQWEISVKWNFRDIGEPALQFYRRLFYCTLQLGYIGGPDVRVLMDAMKIIKAYGDPGEGEVDWLKSKARILPDVHELADLLWVTNDSQDVR